MHTIKRSKKYRKSKRYDPASHGNETHRKPGDGFCFDDFLETDDPEYDPFLYDGLYPECFACPPEKMTEKCLLCAVSDKCIETYEDDIDSLTHIGDNRD